MTAVLTLPRRRRWPSLRRLLARLLAAAPAPAARATALARSEELLRRYGDHVFRLAYSYLHGRADAEDVVQDVLLRYLDTAPVLDGPEHEKAWLLRVAANLCKNRLRDAAAHRTDELSETLAAEEREDLSYVWTAVKALPEAQREAVHLFYYEGYPTAQIAEILGRKESTVRSDLRRARMQLRDLLKEDDDEGSIH